MAAIDSSVRKIVLGAVLCLAQLAAGAATSPSVAGGQVVFNSICSICHGPDPAANVYGIKAGANNPTLIQSLINTNFGGMGILNSQFHLTTTQINDAANYLGSVFYPNQGAPGIASNPPSLVFPAPLAGSSGTSLSLALTNTGNGTLIIFAMTVSASEFGVYSGCGANLGPAQTCFVTLTFTPRSSATVSANLTIQTNADPASLQVALQGQGSGAAPAIGAYSGLWWNPNESGWGLSVSQHRNTIFAAAYSYDAAGLPVWYVMSNCPLSGNGCTGPLYRVSGGTSPAVAWNDAGKTVTNVGTGTLTFSDADNGYFSFALDGAIGSKAITRQSIAAGSIPPSVDYTDLWWNPNESGWGVALTQQYATIFATWYAYDGGGAPRWYVASNCPLVGMGCNGDLYQVTGGSPLTSPWNGAGRLTTRVGSITFAFADANNGTMSYSINGVNGSRTVTRQAF